MKYIKLFEEWSLLEEIEYLRPDYDDEAYTAGLKKIQKVSKDLANKPVMYRGFNAITRWRSSAVLHIINNLSGGRKTFRWTDPRQKDVIAALSTKFKMRLDPPVFTSTDESWASFFGRSHIFIPAEAKTRMIQSDLVKDIGISVSKNTPDSEISSIIDSYYEGYKPGPNEIMVDSDDYYLINLKHFLDSMPGKWQRQFSSIRTYGEVADMVGKRLWLWQQRKLALRASQQK